MDEEEFDAGRDLVEGPVLAEVRTLPIASRLVFPALLKGWTGFGPIGVALTLMTWCGVLGVGWVVTACTGAIIWERSAPAETVIDSQLSSVAAPPT